MSKDITYTEFLPLNKWVTRLGYTWRDEEVMMKGLLGYSEAEALIRQYIQEGLLVRHG